jgi:hypothetical protein
MEEQRIRFSSRLLRHGRRGQRRVALHRVTLAQAFVSSMPIRGHLKVKGPRVRNRGATAKRESLLHLQTNHFSAKRCKKNSAVL